jgi:hypothetical protein
LKPGAIVLFPLCPFSSCIKDFEDDKINNKYYPFLHPILITNYSLQKKQKIMHFVDNPFQASPIKSLIRILSDLPSKEIKTVDMEEDADIFMDSWKNQFSIVDLNDSLSVLNEQNLNYNSKLIIEIVDFCKERDLKPVFVIPPVHKALGLNFSEKFQQNYIYSCVNKEKNSQIVFLNYLNDSRFKDLDLFLNSYYLNDKGRKYFTSLLLKDLGIL